MSPDKQAFIRAKARENQETPESERVLWSRHAIGKLVSEGLTRSQVEHALMACTVIEDYPRISRPLPDCLALGFSEGQPIHVTVAVDLEADRIFIVTVYVPSSERWENDWQTRK